MVCIRLGILAGLALLMTSCSSTEPEPGAAPCPTPTEAPDLSGLPHDLDLARFGTVTMVTEKPRSVGAQAVARTTIVELYPPLARHVLESYDIIASDNEGFEAEIFFERGPITGAFWLREGPCDGDVTIKLLHAKEKGKTDR